MRTGLVQDLTHEFRYQVPAERTVPRLLPESQLFASMPEVLATGYLVGIIEWACMEAIAGFLDDEEISLGTHVDLSHSAPTTPGSEIKVSIEVLSVEGRSILFQVEACDQHGVISSGTHRRGVVNRRRFEQRLEH